jgi:hypothetical protein
MGVRIVGAALAAGLLAGCADDSGGGADDPPASPDASVSTPAPVRATSRLTVTLDLDGKAGATRTWTLECDPPGGDHPDSAGACAQLTAAEAPFAPLPKDVMCTEIYGGPATATINGVWRGTPVAAAYARQNGCHIARWDAVAEVVGAGTAAP